jgi:hypothetical protein
MIPGGGLLRKKSGRRGDFGIYNRLHRQSCAAARIRPSSPANRPGVTVFQQLNK